MIGFFVRVFFNWFYKIKQPEQVQYWKYTNSQNAKKTQAPDGSLEMKVAGEKYALSAVPRGHVLFGSFASLKDTIKNAIFNQIFAEMTKAKYDIPPVERMAPAVKHIWETFEKMEECEITVDMKERIKLIKTVFCAIINEDDAYRFRSQLFFSMIDQNKIKLSKADLYYARGKYWKPDRFKKILGKWYDGYEY